MPWQNGSTMLLGAVTYNICKDWDLETLITKLEAAGFEAVELRTSHKHGVEPSLDAAARRAVSQRFTRSKVRLLSFGSTCEFHAADPAVRARNVAEAKTFIDLAHDTGAWVSRFASTPSPKASRDKPCRTSPPACASWAITARVKAWKPGSRSWPRDRRAAPHGRPHAPDQTSTGRSLLELQSAGHRRQQRQAILPAPPPVDQNVHINELMRPLPYRELFALLRASKYDRYTLCEAQESKEPERFLRWYRALWTELNRNCA
jgi:hypothetical protein